MAQLLYCQHLDCAVGYASTGERPAICPSCERETTWKTTRPNLKLTVSDRRWLRSLRISPDDHLGGTE